MRHPSRARVTGPLAAYSSGFGEELLGQGYTPESAQRQVNLMAHVSRWLESQGLSASELEPDRVVGFLKARRAEGYTLELSERAVRPLLGYLRGLAVVPTPPGPVPSTAVERLLAEYRCYLVSERGLAGTSVCAYLRTAMLFLSACEQQGGPDLEHLTAAHVTDFVVKECPRRQVAAAKVLVTGLRSLLRFLFFAGHTPRELAPAVPARSGWGQASLPRALGPEAVTALLASCDRRTAVGLRDFAVLTVLSRLGLRAAEAAALGLGDIDWHHGEIVVRGKGGHRERLPLPSDVGEALVAYLCEGRPRVEHRAVFVSVHAPVAGLTGAGIAEVVYAACRRAGLPLAGPHRLRHSAATALLRSGASLAEVGQVLRQARAATASIYAKVDRVALRGLAQPWPGCAP